MKLLEYKFGWVSQVYAKCMASHLAFSLHFHAFLLTLFGVLLVIPYVYQLLG